MRTHHQFLHAREVACWLHESAVERRDVAGQSALPGWGSLARPAGRWDHIETVGFTRLAQTCDRLADHYSNRQAVSA